MYKLNLDIPHSYKKIRLGEDFEFYGMMDKWVKLKNQFVYTGIYGGFGERVFAR